MSAMAKALEAALKTAGGIQHAGSGTKYTWVPVGETGAEAWLATSYCRHPLGEALGPTAAFVLAATSASSPRQDADLCLLSKLVKAAGSSAARHAALLRTLSPSDDVQSMQLLASPLLTPLDADTARALLSTYTTASAAIRSQSLPAVVAFCRDFDGRLGFLGVSHSKTAALPEALAPHRIPATAPGSDALSSMTFSNIELFQTDKRVAPVQDELAKIVPSLIDLDRMVRA